MRIVFIGSGNVATHMAVALKNSGNEIVQIYSRTNANANKLAEKVAAESVCELSRLNCDADLYIFSLKDDALSAVIKNMPKTTGIWIHTAGSVPMNIFEERMQNGSCGVIYPLQTFSKERELDFSKVSLFVEGDSVDTEQILLSLAKSLSENVIVLDSENRKYLHLSAVFANNFSNHMYTLAYEILKKRGVPFNVLRPLITETAAKVMEMEPLKAQTGPAIRLDEKVINKHVELIEDEQMKNIYSILSKSINRYST